MRRNHLPCSICAAGATVVAAINAELAKRTPLRKLAIESGFSRSSLSRHGRKCIPRAVIAHHRTRRQSIAGRRLITKWPDGRLTVTEYGDRGHAVENRACQAITADQLDPERDLLLIVNYLQIPVKNRVVGMSKAERAAYFAARKAAELAEKLSDDLAEKPVN